MGYLFWWPSVSKSASELGLEVSEILIIMAGAVLMLGAIGEYLEDHKKLPKWLKWPKLVFILMVVGGLVGEFFGDAGVFVFSGSLQTISDLEVERLRSENLLLEKQIQPRDLTVAQRDAIVTAIRPFAGFMNPKFTVGLSMVYVATYETDLECRRLSGILISVLRRAGLEATLGDESGLSMAHITGPSIVQGIKVLLPTIPSSEIVDQRKVEGLERTLAKLLDDDGLHASVLPIPPLLPGATQGIGAHPTILVGVKPFKK